METTDQILEGLAARYFMVLGVRVTDTYQDVAVRMMERLMRARDARCRAIYFVNSHTLNVAADEPDFHRVLRTADIVFNDGTGVRWAARQRGVTLRDNLNGTDLVPAFFAATKGKGYRYFLLGATPDSIEEAAREARGRFDGWEPAGHHHGYVDDRGSEELIEQINAARVDLLVVGMGNPLQERWIHRHQHQLQVPLAVGAGGLFDFWAGWRKRAPKWMRMIGCEWVHVLATQRYKWRRYILGNPKFLYRMTRAINSDMAHMAEFEAHQRRRRAGTGDLRIDPQTTPSTAVEDLTRYVS